MLNTFVSRLTLRALLSLPTPLLRVAAGGGVAYRGGRTLDPRFQVLAEIGRGNSPLAGLSPEEARAANGRRLARVSGRREPGVMVGSESIDAGDHRFAARTYRSHDQDPSAPVMVFAHQGGGVLGDLQTNDAFCSLLAAVARCPVLSIDYRLAPEHRFPAALDDMVAAYRWALDNGPRLGAPAGRAMVGGEGMGANLAAAACQALKRAAQAQPVLQLLVCPLTDLADESPSQADYAETEPRPRALRAWLADHYMGPEIGPNDPRLSPLRAADLTGLAPAVVAVAGFDSLVAQGEAYARRLAAAGVRVVYRCYDALAHGFTVYTGAVPAAAAACREIAELTRGVIDVGV